MGALLLRCRKIRCVRAVAGVPDIETFDSRFTCWSLLSPAVDEQLSHPLLWYLEAELSLLGHLCLIAFSGDAHALDCLASTFAMV